jgi:hypothetical protein
MAHRFILDTRLSVPHYIVCSEAIRRGIIEPDDLNEGRRTMAEQWAFFRNQPPLAAFPRPTAPHIKVGLDNHDLDVNSFNGASRRLAKFYESLGIDVSFCVGGEDWHICVHSEAQLQRAAAKITRERDRQISKQGETEKRISFFKHQLHFIKDPDTKKPYYRPGTNKPSEGYSDFFNEDLEKAVKAFQRDRGMKADGIIGPATDKAIDKAYSTAKRRRKAAKKRAQERAAKVARGEKL